MRSHRHLLPSLALGLLPSTAWAADDAFLCGKGVIENQSLDNHFKTLDCIELDSWSLGTTTLKAPGDPPGAAPVEVGPLVVQLAGGGPNVVFFGTWAMTGQVIEGLTLYTRTQGAPATAVAMKAVLQGVQVREHVFRGGANDNPRLTLVLDWTGLTLTYSPYDENWKPGTPQTLSWSQGD